MERNNGPSYFPRRHGQEENQVKLYNIVEDQGKTDAPKTSKSFSNKSPQTRQTKQNFITASGSAAINNTTVLVRGIPIM